MCKALAEGGRQKACGHDPCREEATLDTTKCNIKEETVSSQAVAQCTCRYSVYCIDVQNCGGCSISRLLLEPLEDAQEPLWRQDGIAAVRDPLPTPCAANSVPAALRVLARPRRMLLQRRVLDIAPSANDKHDRFGKLHPLVGRARLAHCATLLAWIKEEIVVRRG